MIRPAAMPKNGARALMLRVLRTYVRPYSWKLVLSLLFMAVAAMMTAGIAQLMQPVLDDVLSGARTGLIVPIAGAAFLAFTLRGICTYISTIMTNKIGQSLVGDIQRDLFSHFLTQDLSFFHQNPSGQLISRIINDVNVVRMAVSDSITGLGKNFLTLVFLVAVMFYQDWKLSLIAFAIFPLASSLVMILGKRLRKLSKTLQADTGVLSDMLSQVFQGIRQVQAFGMEDYERARGGKAIDRVRNLNIKAVRISNIMTPVNDVLVGLVLFGIITYGGYEASQGRMTTGQLGAFLAAFMMAYEPMKRMARLNATVNTALGAAERIFDMLDQAPAVVENPGLPALRAPQPQIRFDNVTFHYLGSEAAALNGVSFAAAPGQVTALVGPSGGGKSTIMNLIPRFYDPAGGIVSIDGQDIRGVSLASLRRHIALVSQDITIFDATIAENIAYGSLDKSDADIRRAAQMAAAGDFIAAMPEGYQTRTGEDGVKLSGGQRQRIALARAILRDAPILLLDEATSALDNESEKAVQEALQTLERGRTTIVIAHRLSTVRTADQILVMDQGRIVERGRHEELLKLDGLYARMYHTGLRE